MAAIVSSCFCSSILCRLLGVKSFQQRAIMKTVFTTRELMTRAEWEALGYIIPYMMEPYTYDVKGRGLFTEDQAMRADDYE